MTHTASVSAPIVNPHPVRQARPPVLRHRATALTAPVAAIVVVGGLSGCAAFVDKKQVISAAPEPTRELPTIDDDRPPPKKGMGRVIFDVTDGPATVQWAPTRGSGGADVPRTGAGESDDSNRDARPRVLCVTPCSADLPHGRQPIQIVRHGTTDEGTVQVGAVPTAYRHTMSQIRKSDSGKRAVTATMMTVGLVAAAVGGLVINYTDATSEGLSLLLGGGGLVTGAHFMSVSNRTIERPSSSVQWQLPAITF